MGALDNRTDALDGVPCWGVGTGEDGDTHSGDRLGDDILLTACTLGDLDFSMKSAALSDVFVLRAVCSADTKIAPSVDEARGARRGFLAVGSRLSFSEAGCFPSALTGETLTSATARLICPCCAPFLLVGDIGDKRGCSCLIVHGEEIDERPSSLYRRKFGSFVR